MSYHHARLAAGFLFLAIPFTGCVKSFIPATTPHVYSGGQPAYLTTEDELEAVKREIRRHCHFKHDLDPTFDFPEEVSTDPIEDDENRERCYQLKVRGAKLHASILRSQELEEEAAQAAAEDQGTPDRGRVRFGDGPLEPVKQE